MSLTHPPLHSHPYPRVKEKKEVVPIDVDDDESDSDDEEDNLHQVGLREMGGRVHFTFHTHNRAHLGGMDGQMHSALQTHTRAHARARARTHETHTPQTPPQQQDPQYQKMRAEAEERRKKLEALKNRCVEF